MYDLTIQRRSIALRQRVYPARAPALHDPVPSVAQLVLVKRRPFKYKTPNAAGKSAAGNPQCFDFHESFTFAMLYVEMRRRMFVPVHPYDDSPKPAQFRHVTAAWQATA